MNKHLISQNIIKKLQLILLCTKIVQKHWDLNVISIPTEIHYKTYVIECFQLIASYRFAFVFNK